MPQQWNYPNGYSQPAPWEYGYPPTDAQLQQPDSRHHSTSPSTLKSDRLTSGHGDLPDTAVLPNPEDSIETNPWRSTTLGTLRHAPANGLETPSSLVEYLLENLNNEEYADCRLNMIHENNRFAKADWSLSSLLIARSPRLRDTLRVSMPGEDGKRIIRLEVQGRFITPKSVEAALRVCYGEPTNAFTGANPHELISAPKANVSASSMDDCLDYVATGCILQLKEAALQGLEVASKILNWENLEAAVSFGLESVRQRGENASAAVIEVSNYIRIGADYTYLASEGDPSPSSCALFTPPSQQGPENAAELMPPERRYGPPVQSAYDLLIHCLRYIRDNFPTSWELDVTARPLADVDRLPVTRNSRSPLSRSRLGHIQFGQMPSEVEKGSSNPDVLISTIVLSVPFLWLNFILKTMGEPICRNLVSIVNERERRRHIILQSEDVNKKQRMVADAYEWGEAGFEESVKIADDGGMILSRRFTGIAGGPSPYTKVNLTDE